MQHKLRMITLACCAALAIGACGRSPSDPSGSAATAVRIALIPAPRELTRTVGQFAVTSSTPVTFASEPGAEAAARYFLDLLQRTEGPALQAGPGSPAGISFQLDDRESATGDEAYTLDISPRGVSVSAASSRGLFYGAVTLWQLLTPGASEGVVMLPAMTIKDAPRFRWRGLMLDSARHYQSPEFIKRFIDTMATHKLNVLHWHLTDDQAWRLQIKKYPRLTEIGAWRVPAGAAAANDIDPATRAPRLHGGFYTQEEVKDIVAYAAARHITIVPEIEMPGHASAPIAAYPALGVQDVASRRSPEPHPPSDWGVYPHLFNVEEATFDFLEDVLTEVMALFPSEYIHVGGDEAVKDQWRGSARVQARMRELGIADEHALQSYFIQRMEQFLSARGRRLIGWDEILEGGLAPNATVMSWRGIDGAIAAARAGHDAVLSPHPTLYFDNRPFDAPVPGRGRLISIKDVYEFDPAPAQLDAAQREHILGVQANIWVEHIRTEARVEYMTFPRAAALAEVAWSLRDRIQWEDFSRRLPAQLARYRALGVAYAQPDARTPSSTRFISHDLTLCSENIALSLEDDGPVRGERAVFLVDIMNPCWKLPDVDLTQARRLDAAVGQVPFNFQIGADMQKIELRPPVTAAGELEVRLGCDGELLASLTIAPALGDFGVTALPSATLPARPGRHELCFRFTQAKLDPIWVLHSIELAAMEPRAAE